MNNLSLARIMYGTNEDLHAPASMSASAFSSRERLSSPASVASEPAPAPGKLQHFFQKAWSAFHLKG